MKKITFTLSAVTAVASMASLACLTGCESHHPTDWSNNCEANYSLSSREMSECLAKVEKGANVEIEPGTVGIDPDNTSRKSYDSIGKGGAGDSN
tara:strand:+ start:2098 stop:2379 length:282 start_codon:yes stop_codon:yes gene_type:complete